MTRWAFRLWSAGIALVLIAPVAWAEEPVDFQFGFQPSASPVRDRMDQLHNHILLPIITVITIFVLSLLLTVIVRFRASHHPVPRQTTHNTALELAWTTLPILILLFIAVPSFRLLYYVDRAQKADLTLKVTGHQWYWSYAYPDQSVDDFDSRYFMAGEEDKPVPPGHKRLLEVGEPTVLPVGKTVRILVSGTDVIHSWFVPALGVQEYAVDGRTNESWTEIERADTYYGQCNQICGLNHPFMPIEIVAVSPPAFDQWVACMKDPKKPSEPGYCARKAVAADRDGGQAPVRVAARTAP